MKRINKGPDHAPWASPEDQQKGLEFIAKFVTMDEYERTLDIMVWKRWMSKAKRRVLLRRLRKIKGISYKEWRRTRRKKDARDFPSGLYNDPTDGMLW